MEVFGAAEMVGGQTLDRQFHRIHRISTAGEHRQLEQLMNRFLQGLPRLPALQLRPGEQLLHPHAVLGERAGLVDGKHRGAAEALHRRGPAGQHPDPGQAQGAEGQEQGQHHGNLVGQHRQGQGQGGEQGLGPVAADRSLDHRQGRAEPQRQHGEAPGEATGLALQPGGWRLHRGQAAAEPAQFGGLSHGHHLGPAAATGHQRTRQDPLPGRGAGDRQRFTGEQGLIQPQPHPLAEGGIGRHPIAFFQPEPIAHTHLLGRQVQLLAVAAHVGAGRRQAGQLGQGTVAALLLDGIEQADAHHEHQQDAAIDPFPDHAIDQGTGQQQQVGGLQPAHLGSARAFASSGICRPGRSIPALSVDSDQIQAGGSGGEVGDRAQTRELAHAPRVGGSQVQPHLHHTVAAGLIGRAHPAHPRREGAGEGATEAVDPGGLAQVDAGQVAVGDLGDGLEPVTGAQLQHAHHAGPFPDAGVEAHHLAGHGGTQFGVPQIGVGAGDRLAGFADAGLQFDQLLLALQQIGAGIAALQQPTLGLEGRAGVELGQQLDQAGAVADSRDRSGELAGPPCKVTVAVPFRDGTRGSARRRRGSSAFVHGPLDAQPA